VGQRQIKILQLVPAAAGWRVAMAEHLDARWRIVWEPIATFALCEITADENTVDEITWQEVVPILRGEGVLETWTDSDLGNHRLVGPGFHAFINNEGYIDVKPEQEPF